MSKIREGGAAKFPPPLAIGSRVWTNVGFRQHGPIEGPKQDIEGPQGGEIVAAQKPWMTTDQLLYTVRGTTDKPQNIMTANFSQLGDSKPALSLSRRSA